jgi:IclR family transcriptional regulator, KDG regulon repressor
MAGRGESDPHIQIALKILELFGGTQTRFRFDEIKGKVDGSGEEITTAVHTLESEGFLDMDYDAKAFRLGHRIFQLGMRYAAEMEIAQTIRPYAESLSRRFDEAVNVGFQVGTGVVVAMRIEPDHRFMVIPGAGSSIPIHSSSLGKALLAYQDESHVRQTLTAAEMQVFTANTERDIDQFVKSLEKVRERGYSVDNEETLPGVCSIAAPILDHRSTAIAAISLTGSRQRIDPENLEMINAVRETGLAISRLLGFPYAG